jgi:hypothetical protein
MPCRQIPRSPNRMAKRSDEKGVEEKKSERREKGMTVPL